jgi:O-acetylserine/cysteine efflux transporter
VIWGSSFVAIQAGLQSIGPLFLVAVRFDLAATMAVGAAAILGLYRTTLEELRGRRIWALGALYALGFTLQFVGQIGAGVANSTLLSNVFPALVPLFAGPLLHERFGGRHAISVILGLVGLVIVTVPGITSGNSTFTGDCCLLGSTLVYAMFIVLSKRVGTDSPSSAFSLIVVMGVVLAPITVAISLTQPTSIASTASEWWIVLYLALPCTIIALALYLEGLRWVTASRSSVLLLLEPTTGLVLAALLYRAAVTLPVVAGGIFIVSAIAFACWPEARPPSR